MPSALFTNNSLPLGEGAGAQVARLRRRLPPPGTFFQATLTHPATRFASRNGAFRVFFIKFRGGGLFAKAGRGTVAAFANSPPPRGFLTAGSRIFYAVVPRVEFHCRNAFPRPPEVCVRVGKAGGPTSGIPTREPIPQCELSSHCELSSQYGRQKPFKTLAFLHFGGPECGRKNSTV